MVDESSVREIEGTSQTEILLHGIFTLSLKVLRPTDSLHKGIFHQGWKKILFSSCPAFQDFIFSANFIFLIVVVRVLHFSIFALVTGRRPRWLKVGV